MTKDITNTGNSERPEPPIEAVEDSDPSTVRFTAVFMHRLTPSSRLDEFALDAMLAQSAGKNSRQRGK